MERLDPNGNYFKNIIAMVNNPDNQIPLKERDLDYVHFPIYDKTVAEDDDILGLVENLYTRLNEGENLFVHCRGGHGRTGVVMCLLYAKIFPQLDAYEVLERIQRYHNTRKDVIDSGFHYVCPETSEQTSQIYRVISRMKSESEV